MNNKYKTEEERVIGRRETLRKSSRLWYIKNREARLEQCKKYKSSNAGKEVQYKADVRRRERDPISYKARAKFRYAVYVGKIKRQPCSVCGEPNAQGHHEDYSKPYDVIWFCSYHHKLHEGKIIVKRAEI